MHGLWGYVADWIVDALLWLAVAVLGVFFAVVVLCMTYGAYWS